MAPVLTAVDGDVFVLIIENCRIRGEFERNNKHGMQGFS